MTWGRSSESFIGGASADFEAPVANNWTIATKINLDRRSTVGDSRCRLGGDVFRGNHELWDSSISLATMTDAFDCYDEHDIQDRVNHAVVANPNPVCISSVHKSATAGRARVLG
jgi:hypothetical protein